MEVIRPPRPFAYLRPESLPAALDAMASDGAAALAGGTDLVMLRAAGVLEPLSLVDLKSIPELGRIKIKAFAGVVIVGATTTMNALVSGLAGHGVDALVDGARVVGGVQTRVRATVGGNICRSSPAGDTLPGLLVLGATVSLASSGGIRDVPLNVFFSGPGTNVIRPDELLTTVKVRATREGGSAFGRLTPRHWMDLAVVSVAARIDLDQSGVCRSAAIAVGAAAPTPILVPDAGEVLVGTQVDTNAIDDLCEAIAGALDPIDDVRATRRYRLAAVRPLARRVAKQALDRARESRGEA